jgi:hypothetical protein
MYHILTHQVPTVTRDSRIIQNFTVAQMLLIHGQACSSETGVYEVMDGWYNNKYTAMILSGGPYLHTVCTGKDVQGYLCDLWLVTKVKKCAKHPKIYLFLVNSGHFGGCDTQRSLHRTSCDVWLHHTVGGKYIEAHTVPFQPSVHRVWHVMVVNTINLNHCSHPAVSCDACQNSSHAESSQMAVCAILRCCCADQKMQ